MLLLSTLALQICGLSPLDLTAQESAPADSKGGAPAQAEGSGAPPSPADAGLRRFEADPIASPADAGKSPSDRGPVAESSEIDSPFDFAEIYVDRYFPPGSALELDKAGLVRSQALARYARGLALEEQGDYAGAARAFREVLDRQPEEVGLAKRVAYLLAQDGQTEAAQGVLEDTLKRNPKRPLAHLNLSEYLATYHAGEEALQRRSLDLAREAVRLFPLDPRVYDHAVKVLLVARKRDEAKSVVTRALEQGSEDPQFYLHLARVAARVWPQAPGGQAEPLMLNAIYDKALEHADAEASAEVLEKAADYFHASHQFPKARDLYREILAVHPESLEVREKLARVYGALGDTEAVIETLETLAQINPQDLDTQKKLARIYLSRGLDLRDEVLSNPALEDQLWDNIDRAIDHFENAFRLAKGSPSEYDQVSRLLLWRRRAEEATEMLKSAVFHYPDVPELVRQLAYAHSRANQYKESLRHFERTVSLASQGKPDLLDAEFYFQFGAASERTGDLDRAESLFRKSMDLLDEEEIDSESARAFSAQVYNYLGYMWLENDTNIDEAGELIRTAYELSPDSGAIADSMGWFYFKKGRYEDAKRELEKAKRVMGEPDPVVYDHLAQTYFQLGDKASALEHLREAVDLEPDNEDYQKRLKEMMKAEPPVVSPEQAPGTKPGRSEEGEANPAEAADAVERDAA